MGQASKRDKSRLTGSSSWLRRFRLGRLGSRHVKEFLCFWIPGENVREPGKRSPLSACSAKGEHVSSQPQDRQGVVNKDIGCTTTRNAKSNDSDWELIVDLDALDSLTGNKIDQNFRPTVRPSEILQDPVRPPFYSVPRASPHIGTSRHGKLNSKPLPPIPDIVVSETLGGQESCQLDDWGLSFRQAVQASRTSEQDWYSLERHQISVFDGNSLAQTSSRGCRTVRESCSSWGSYSLRYSVFSVDNTVQEPLAEAEDELELESPYWEDDPESGKSYHIDSVTGEKFWYPDHFD